MNIKGGEKDEKGNKVPLEGKLFYRGYDVEDLVNNVLLEDRFGFEEIAYLLLMGELPTKKELAAYNDLIGEHRELPMGFARDMILTAPSKNIMNKLARSVLALYSFDDNPDDISLPNVLRQSMNLMGYFPAIICYAYQAKSSYYDKKSLHLHDPIRELSTSENILRMLRPMGEYSEIEAKILDLCMILHAEHGGGNNSTFSTRVLSSSGTDTYAAISAAIGSLKGPRHGGANLRVRSMMMDMKENVRDWSDEDEIYSYLASLVRKERGDGSGLVYGFGHAIYTLSDPRAVILKRTAEKLAEEKDMLKEFELYKTVEKLTPDVLLNVKGSSKVICANVDFYSGFVYDMLGIPSELFTPLFAVSRIAGWCAHRIEEAAYGGRIIRPAYRSMVKSKRYIPIAQRNS